MNILVLGGTRFFGVHLVRELIKQGHKVTIATRGNKVDEFGDRVNRIKVDHANFIEMKNAFLNKKYDVVYDDIAYASLDVKYALETIKCDKYIMVSTSAVYDLKWDTKETDFDSCNQELIWCNRDEYSYATTKKQAECALFQCYKDQKFIAVRFPFVLGKDDYTNRLRFYVENIIKGKEMKIDNYNQQIGFILSEEAGKFLAFLADKDFCGAINGSSDGTISMEEIASYVSKACGKTPILSNEGEEAPYNGVPKYFLNTDRGKQLGFEFTPVKDYIYDLLDYYLSQIK